MRGKVPLKFHRRGGNRQFDHQKRKDAAQNELHGQSCNPPRLVCAAYFPTAASSPTGTVSDVAEGISCLSGFNRDRKVTVNVSRSSEFRFSIAASLAKSSPALETKISA